MYIVHVAASWLVHILPEEVGSFLSIVGPSLLVLNSASQQLELYNHPGVNVTPTIWPNSSVQRVGRLLNIIFIEIHISYLGTERLWMHTHKQRRDSLREALL